MHVLPKSDDEFRHIRLYKGELLALRAYLHFEMARIFAVPFASGDAAAKAKAIPYVTKYGMEVTPYSSLEKVFELIVADLTEAEKYLAADEELVTATRTNASDGFTSCRITHLNLYAVQALLARAYWTMGNLDLAEDYAEKVIDSGKFPLMTTAEAWNAVETGTLNMQETVFGLYSTQYTYNFYRNHIYQAEPLRFPASIPKSTPPTSPVRTSVTRPGSTRAIRGASNTTTRCTPRERPTPRTAANRSPDRA